MKRLHKIGLLSAGLLAMTFVVSSCTGNFCTDQDKSRMLFAVEPGVSTYYNTQEEALEAKASLHESSIVEQVKGSNVWRVVGKDEAGSFAMYDYSQSKYVTLTQLGTILGNAANNGAYRPSDRYFAALDQKVLVAAFERNDKGFTLSNTNVDQVKDVLSDFGYVKFYSGTSLWDNYDRFNA